MKPNRTEQRRIEMLMANTVKTFNIHELEISDDNGTFTLETEVIQVDRDVIMNIPNPQYQDVLKKYSHLKGVKIIDEDTKKELPVQIILGASDYSRIKTSTGTRVGNPGEPIAEYTRLGWTLMSPGKVGEHESMMLTRSTIEDYSQLCALDVLGLEDKPDGDQSTVYDEFKEQLVRSKEGWYETKLPWKANHTKLPNIKEESLGRLNSLVKQLQKDPDLFEKYDEIIKDQLAKRIVEKAPSEANGKEFYIPHKPVVRESAESTKVRIVYDASARAYGEAPSLNECLEKTLRFTKALFGLGPSPFLLGGTIAQHMENSRDEYPEEVEKNQS